MKKLMNNPPPILSDFEFSIGMGKTVDVESIHQLRKEFEESEEKSMNDPNFSTLSITLDLNDVLMVDLGNPNAIDLDVQIPKDEELMKLSYSDWFEYPNREYGGRRCDENGELPWYEKWLDLQKEHLDWRPSGIMKHCITNLSTNTQMKAVGKLVRKWDG